MLVSLLAATLGTNVGYAETAAGAVDYVLTGGSSAQAATHTCVPCVRRTSFASTRHGPGAAVGSKSVLGRLVACKRTCLNRLEYLAIRSQRARARPLNP